jgi:hypothetical protein
MNIFYTSLKNHVKDKIIKGDRSNELIDMIEIIIRINNHVYER